ncbi:MAG: putative toxin-antitoxin system toxin component, PIN family [Nanoarchaeota archaeon]
MGPPIIVVDTNVLLSASLHGGKPLKISRMIRLNLRQLAISEKQLRELERILTYPKFNLSKGQQTTILLTINALAQVVTTPLKVQVIDDDPTDNMIIETALQAGAATIITGDKHLLKLGHFHKIEIVTPHEFLRRVAQEINGR